MGEIRHRITHSFTNVMVTVDTGYGNIVVKAGDIVIVKNEVASEGMDSGFHLKSIRMELSNIRDLESVESNWDDWIYFIEKNKEIGHSHQKVTVMQDEK